MKSFFAGGGNVPWSISGLSLFMGFFSAGTFVVWGSIAYSLGWVAITIQLTMAIAGFVVGSWIAPRWQRTHALTAAEYITERLGANVQRIYTYLFLSVSIFTTGSFLYPVAKILEVSTGVSLEVCILLLGGFSMLYVAIGGLRGVVVTDVLQFVILFAAVIIVIPLSFDKIGGVSALLQQAPEGFFRGFNGEYSIGFILAFGVYNLFFLGGNWAYVQRYTSVRTEKDSRKVGWLFGALYLVSPLLWMLPPMIYRIYNPDLIGLQNEGAYLLMCKVAMPAGLLGLMLGGMIFATASSLNGTLNISAGVFTNDIYKRLYPQSTDRQLIRIARYSTLCFGLLAVLVALLIRSMGGIVNVVISIGALTGVPLYLPIIWTLFSKRQTARSVLGTTFISLGINLFFKFLSPILFGFSLDREAEMIVGSLTPVICLAIYEIWAFYAGSTDPRYVILREKQERPETLPSDNKANLFTLYILGGGILFSGTAILLLGVFTSENNYMPISMGIILMFIGGVLLLKALLKKQI